MGTSLRMPLIEYMQEYENRQFEYCTQKWVKLNKIAILGATVVIES